MSPLAWVSVLIALVCFAPAGNGQKPCPPGCKSFVTLGNLAGKQEIGPAAEMAWNVLSTSTYTVNRVSVRIALLLSKSNLPKVSIFVSGNQIFNFEVNTTVIQFSFSYDFMSGAIVGNGSVLLLPGNGMGTAIPQLVVKFQGVADGASGGVNGSLVVFNVNQPDPSNYLDLGSVQLSWTACISKSGPFPQLLNATVWVTIEGVVLGASYLDLFNGASSNFYSIGGATGTSLNLSLMYMESGVMQQSRICDLTHGCVTNSFELFSVLTC